MSRIKDLAVEDMTPEQRRIRDDIVSGPRGQLQGPLKVWLTSPDLADKAQKLGQFCRFETSLPTHLSELAILVTGRFWGAEFEWYAHKRIGLEAGLDPALIEAIRERRVPTFKTDAERIVYEFATQLHRDHRVGDATYAAAGERVRRGRRRRSSRRARLLHADFDDPEHVPRALAGRCFARTRLSAGR